MKRQILTLLRGLGVFRIARYLSSERPRILMYHNFSARSRAEGSEVGVEALRQHLTHLSRHFRVVSLQEMVTELRSGQKFARPTAVLTVDDGRRNCYEYFFPLLKEFELPATLFVVASFIRGEDWIWTDKVLWLSEQASRPDFLTANQIDQFFYRLNRLRPEERNRQIADLALNMKVTLPRQAPPKYAPCSWKELREMSDSGLVEIGSHTVSHPILSSLTDEESLAELTASKAQIEAELGSKVRSFCFPNGQPEDYRPSQLNQTRQAGYECAVVTAPGLVNAASSPLELPRIGMAGWSDELLFAKYVDGVDFYQTKLRHSLGK